jgi:hypothetical protein
VGEQEDFTVNFDMRWVTLAKYCATTGETPTAVRKRRERGVWLDGRHTQVRNRRLWVNVEAAQQWVEGTGS